MVLPLYGVIYELVYAVVGCVDCDMDCAGGPHKEHLIMLFACFHLEIRFGQGTLPDMTWCMREWVCLL